ncbi:hypothetical protein RhiirB3_427819 [Rhizophagus irregularis]|nr:hypothetical protein RhiirB3_427819 [Rhizophagus irregularis]
MLQFGKIARTVLASLQISSSVIETSNNATVRANTIVRKTRSNKKDTICEHCGHEYSTPQKLCEHFKQKNPCKPLQKQKEVAYIQTPIQVPIQKANQQAIQASEIKA